MTHNWSKWSKLTKRRRPWVNARSNSSPPIISHMIKGARARAYEQAREDLIDLPQMKKFPNWIPTLCLVIVPFTDEWWLHSWSDPMVDYTHARVGRRSRKQSLKDRRRSARVVKSDGMQLHLHPTLHSAAREIRISAIPKMSKTRRASKFKLVCCC